MAVKKSHMKPTLTILTSEKSAHVVAHADSPSVGSAFDVRRSFFLDRGNMPNVVYTQMYGQRAIFEQLARCTVPYVVNVGGDIWSEREVMGKTSSLSEITNVLQQAARVVCVSKFLAKTVRQRLGTNNVISLPGGMWGLDHTKHGIRPDEFAVKKSYVLDEQPLVLMSINLTVKKKWCGIPDFLDATEDVMRSHGARLICFGKAKREVSLLAEWANRGLEFYRPHHDWPLIMARCGVFVHPSMFDGFPRVVAEACCAGLPALVYDEAGFSEVSDSVIMVKSNDPDQIAHKLKSLLESKQNRERVGKAMRREAVRKTKRHRDDYTKLLLEVVKENR
jgi:glycosyltransferase involved in cell wall biosynthesis